MEEVRYWTWRQPWREALAWQLYKDCLTWKLIDLGLEEAPDEVRDSEYDDVSIEIEGDDFVLTYPY